eukprot:763262-Hanusia_phi.AAC.2
MCGGGRSTDLNSDIARPCQMDDVPQESELAEQTAIRLPEQRNASKELDVADANGRSVMQEEAEARLREKAEERGDSAAKCTTILLSG